MTYHITKCLVFIILVLVVLVGANFSPSSSSISLLSSRVESGCRSWKKKNFYRTRHFIYFCSCRSHMIFEYHVVFRHIGRVHNSISLICIISSLPFQFVFLVINMLAVVLCQYAGRLSPANMLAISLSFSFSYVQLIENG